MKVDLMVAWTADLMDELRAGTRVVWKAEMSAGHWVRRWAGQLAQRRAALMVDHWVDHLADHSVDHLAGQMVGHWVDL